MVSALFQEFTINNLVLRNRFIMSAAADNLEHAPQAQVNRFAQLAQGQIGLIISGGTRVKKIEALQDVIKAVHQNGGKFAIQIVAESGPGVYCASASGHENSIAVSVLPKDHIYFKSLAPLINYAPHHAASDAEFAEIIRRYAKAAILAKQIGADAIQVHAAHQNFLSQMLSPLTNTRNDKWGGSVENRTRLHCEIYKAMRSEVGEAFPILIKLGVQDAIAGGLKFEEGKEAAKLIADCGYDALEVSQGLQDYTDLTKGIPMRPFIRKIEDEAYFKSWSYEIKRIISKPVILTGGLRSIEVMEQLLQNHTADCFGMCRPFIREPSLIKRWQNGDFHKATCISCNKCLTELLFRGKPLECYLDKKHAG